MPTSYALQTKHQALPALDFLLLLALATGRPKEWLLARPEYRLSPLAYIRLRYYLWRYAHGHSIAAITRRKEFFGLDFYVNRYVLVPRPETELIVESVINEIRSQPTTYQLQATCLVDIGTGSGCIPIAVMKALKHENTRTQEHENIKTWAIDISRLALRVARRNAKRHGVNITFLHGNLLEPFLSLRVPTRSGRSNPLPSKLGSKIQGIAASPLDKLGAPRNDTIIITANLPYLTAAEFAAEPSIRHEPRIALVADADDGLSLYQKLLQQINQLIYHYPNISISAFFEISPAQPTPITALIKKYLPAATVEIKKDLAERDRVVTLKL